MLLCLLVSWGGGIYETDTFYETADRLGLIILQDGSFFGSYPTMNKHQDPESPENKAVSEPYSTLEHLATCHKLI